MLAYGMGTANFKTSSEPIDRVIVEAAKNAIQAGFRHLDGAEVYGNEIEMGLAIKTSGVPREELYVATKLWDMTNPKASFELSLRRLGLEFVDLYLIHAPFNARSDVELQCAWAHMEELKLSGRVRSIGVSNFKLSHLRAILKTATVPPAINQIEYHPYIQDDYLLRFHKQHNIAIAAYGCLLPLTREADDSMVGVWQDLAQNYEVTISDIGLRWSVEQGLITITTTSKPKRMEIILRNVPGFQLTKDDMTKIAKAGEGHRQRGFWIDNFGELEEPEEATI
ncbi:NAD/NADP-dependent indole-3-acetaldehyde reductase [Colletotrichum kahawae]|uniref:NAD/NADP-dependent indole-3-acetaldehyde reductase n=1 Tax=Colletotrichum kahawae TaxID=34407 RepID=A0AAD9YRV3_COLKA|nr:NAD/NADP-dependent indole-3-acetaldehyde reductase [Colletotrichum kahawae]